MKCKKCRKTISDDSKFCNYCGCAIKTTKLYRRKDGLYEKTLTFNGKRKYFRGKTEKEVYRKIAEYQDKQENGPLFSELVEDWQDEYCPQLGNATVHGYAAAINKALKYFDGVYVNDIKTYDIQVFLSEIPKSFSKNTIRNYNSALSSIFEFAVRSKKYEIEYNPCHHTKIVGKEKVERRIATDKECEIIVANYNIPFGLFACFLLLTGCRRGEALALTWEDIDFKNKTVSINKSLTWINCRPTIKNPKTKKSIRNIVLLDELIDLLPKNKHGIIFPSYQGTYMTENQYAKMWNKYYKNSGLKEYDEANGLTKLTAHCLRHGYATILYEANIDVKNAQAFLGHSKEATTRDIYTHITDTHQQESIDKLNLFINNKFNNYKEKKSS